MELKSTHTAAALEWMPFFRPPVLKRLTWTSNQTLRLANNSCSGKGGTWNLGERLEIGEATVKEHSIMVGAVLVFDRVRVFLLL